MNEWIEVAFPGLGIESFSLNKIAFSVFGLEVRWYGIFITLGILFACWYTMFRGKRNEGIIPDDVIDIAIVTVLLGVLGARLYYVLTTLDEYSYKSLIDVIAIWNGGLAIYGGIIGGCLGIVLVCMVKKLSWRKLFDMAAPGVMIAQAIGRWGNFFNGEAHGYAIGETTSFYFFNTEHVIASGEGTIFHTLRMGLSHVVGGRMLYYHPTFFYESMWNVLGFVLINLLYKRKKFDGQVALLYFAWYGFGRMFIEGLRTDSLCIPGTTLRISQCLGLVCFVAATLAVVGLLILHRYRPDWNWFAPQKRVAAVAASAEVAETAEVADAADAAETADASALEPEFFENQDTPDEESEEQDNGNEN